jgi:HAMP domain-containing protein
MVISSIRFKIVGSLAILVVIGIVSIVAVYFQSRNAIINSIGASRVELAQEILNRIELDIYTRMSDLRASAELPSLLAPIIEKNSELDQYSAVERDALISEKDFEWVRAVEDRVTTEFMKGIVNSELSRDLKQQFVVSLQDEYGYRVFEEVIATDKYGGTVAATNITSDYYQADEEWWQHAAEDGNHVGQVEYDESTGVLVVPVSFAIYDEDGDFAGVYKIGFSNQEIVQEITYISSQFPEQNISLVNDSGELIYSTTAYNILTSVADKEYFKRAQVGEEYFVLDNDGQERLYGVGRAQGYRNLDRTNLILFVESAIIEESGLFAGSFKIGTFVLLSAMFILLFANLVVYLLSKLVIQRLQVLQREAEDISIKGLDRKIDERLQKGNDEVSSLAQTLEAMRVSLKDLYANLELKVQERTEELEESKAKAEKQAEELQRFNNLAIDREQKMIELKKELEAFKGKNVSVENDNEEKS